MSSSLKPFVSSQDGLTTQPRDLKLDLSIENFGPIASGNISLKPLTVLIGPNNSGKSYAALLIHSIVQQQYDSIQPHFSRPLNPNSDILNSELSKHFKSKKSFMLSHNIRTKFTSTFLKKLDKEISQNISRNFSTEYTHLAKRNSKSSRLEIKSNLNNAVINLKNGNISNESLNSPQIQINLGKSFNKDTDFISTLDDEKNRISIDLPNPNKKILKRLQSGLSVDLSYHLVEYFNKFVTRSIYFPAGRSHMIQEHKTIITSMLENSTFGRFENSQISKLSGVTSDFIGGFLNLKQGNDYFAKDVARLEKDILKGEIIVMPPSPIEPTDIKYKQSDEIFYLHSVSSSVSELAPIVLYLKYIVRPGDLLVIEEPEAHLHPDNQAKFAKFLISLIKKGLKIVVTTHSPFILEQISHSLQAGPLPKPLLEKAGYTKNQILSKDDVSVYLFEPSKLGYVIKPLKVSVKEGVPQEVFVKISMKLYDNYLVLRSYLDRD